MSATLRVVSGPAAGETVALDREIVVGREGADLTIDDPELSRRHVAIRPAGQGVEIEDLGSMNGTFVNGSRASEPVTLTVGGTVKAGGTEIAVELPVAATRVREVPAMPGEIAPAGAPTKVGDVVAPAGEPEGEVIAPAGAPTKVGEVIAPAGAPTKVGEVIAPAGAPTKVGAVPAADAPPPAAADAPPPPAAEPPAAATAAEPPAAPPAPPAAAPPQAPGEPPAGAPAAPRRGIPWLPILIGLLVVAAIAVVLVLVLGGDDDASAEAHPLNGRVKTAVLSVPGALTTVGGIEDSKATGRMSVLVIRHVKQQPIPGGSPVPLQLDVTFSGPRGSFFGEVHGTVQLGPKGEEIVRGKAAKITKGTGDFEDISGNFVIAGNNAPGTSISRFSLKGDTDF